LCGTVSVRGYTITLIPFSPENLSWDCMGKWLKILSCSFILLASSTSKYLLLFKLWIIMLSDMNLILYKANLIETISWNRSRWQVLIASAREETLLLLVLDIVTSKIFLPLLEMRQLRVISPPTKNLSNLSGLSGTLELSDFSLS